MKAKVAPNPLPWIGVALVVATVIVFGMAVLAVGPFSQPSSPPSIPPPPKVGIVNYSYQPAQLTVKAGTKVTWTNMDPVEHTVTVSSQGGSSTGTINSGLLEPDQRFSITFDIPGTYEYHCDVHPTMMGTVKVTG